MNREQYHANRRTLYKARQEYRTYTSSGNQGYNSYTDAGMSRRLTEAANKVPRNRSCQRERDWLTHQFYRRLHITELINERRWAKGKGLQLWPFDEKLQREIQFYRKRHKEGLV